MRILITGNMGYVGPGVVAQLRRSYPDAHLVGLDHGWFAHCLTSRAVLPETVLDEQRFGDVRKVTRADLEGFDAVVHLAAVSNDPMGNKFAAVTDAINHRASVHLARVASAAGVKRFVFASSCSIYGFAADGQPRTEKDPVAPLTAYARSKIATEEGLAGLNSDLEITCLRFATACGFSPRLRLDLVLNDFVAGALTSGEISVLSDGTPWRPLIHVRDMARAIDWAIQRGSTVSDRFLTVNAGSKQWNYQVRELADAVGKVLPGVKVSVNPNAPPDKRSYKVDFSLFERLAPNHQPQETLEGSVAELIDGLRSIGFADPDYRQSHLIRLKVLEGLMESGALTDDLTWRHAAQRRPVHEVQSLAS
ncbi:NAD-dependent epimerase/dehydratase family protein [Salinarimonas soli]|uniref:SDR family oxidoreductase n=1 Tax=Salinarimonas soli TaxID=1638099 RepID=A0A5B2VX39_9HYPH|nr:NAD-dependent epimerase/dehydratase family protein [Salinarimonas soli]KAA2244403.1 SDR family oxidoreductase [Salinarimonas soli]